MHSWFGIQAAHLQRATLSVEMTRKIFPPVPLLQSPPSIIVLSSIAPLDMNRYRKLVDHQRSFWSPLFFRRRTQRSFTPHPGFFFQQKTPGGATRNVPVGFIQPKQKNLFSPPSIYFTCPLSDPAFFHGGGQQNSQDLNCVYRISLFLSPGNVGADFFVLTSSHTCNSVALLPRKSLLP